MKFKKLDDFVDFFMDYVWFKNKERAQTHTVEEIGQSLEQLSWLYDIIIMVIWVLIKKKILTQRDLKKIFYHG